MPVNSSWEQHRIAVLQKCILLSHYSSNAIFRSSSWEGTSTTTNNHDDDCKPANRPSSEMKKMTNLAADREKESKVPSSGPPQCHCCNSTSAKAGGSCATFDTLILQITCIKYQGASSLDIPGFLLEYNRKGFDGV